MKKTLKLLLICTLAAVLLLAGCGESKRDFCRVDGRDISFASSKDKARWQKQLEHLLSNPAVAVTSGQYEIDHVPRDPSRPHIERGYYYGLMDIDLNGRPELIVDLGGGSAGNAFYYLYDIESGEHIATIDGEIGGGWCIYYDTEADALRWVGQYSYRGGWDRRHDYVTVITKDASTGEYCEKLCFDVTHTIEPQYAEEGNCDSHIGEIYIAEYAVNGKDADVDTFRGEYERFFSQMIRLPGTELCLYSWSDVTDSEDYDERAEKMAEALISSRQNIIIP